MRAVACAGSELSVVDRPDPAPGRGQLLVDVARCGICGSDLHARVHADELADLMDELEYRDFMRSRDAVVFGHEFCGEVVEAGPGCRGSAPVGTPVVAVPMLRGADGAVHPTGLTAKADGAYAEQVLVEESLAFAVPNGLSPDVSVLTEPVAVAWHAVRRGEVGKRDTAIVIGCGPIGLAVICVLKARGVERIVASDPSAGRRALATACGAQVVVDPTAQSPYAAAGDDFLTNAPDTLELAVGSTEKLRRLPADAWRHVWRAADALGKAAPKAPVVFECVGVAGMLDGVISGAPLFSRVVVVGVCMDADRIRPAMAINKEIDLRFVLAYTPLEYRDTLHALAEGKLDASPLVTGAVGLDGVATAFETLGAADAHAKILIDPKSAATAP